jgi:hypothetical protein
VKRVDAEVLRDALQEHIAGRDGWERHAFELKDLWIEDDAGECVVKVVYRQRPGDWCGYTQHEVTPTYQQRRVTPEEVANDIYDFTLLEPGPLPPTSPGEDGVRWWPAQD